MKKTITTTTITDDFGAIGAAQTVVFTYEARTYEIDLSKRNAETFERRIQALYAPYIEAGRDITPEPGKRPPAASRAFTRRARDWARTNNWEISTRGRVPDEIQAAYTAATGDQP